MQRPQVRCVVVLERPYCAFLCRAKLRGGPQEMLAIFVTAVPGIENTLRLGQLLLGLGIRDLVGHPGVLAQDGHPTLGHRDEAPVDRNDLRVPSSQKITTPLGSSTPSTGDVTGRIPISLLTVFAMTLDDWPDQTTRSAETTSTCIAHSCSAFCLELGPAALDVFHVADVEERLLGDVVDLALADHLERLDRLGQRHG
jgi:hypothetical protein